MNETCHRADIIFACHKMAEKSSTLKSTLSKYEQIWISCTCFLIGIKAFNHTNFYLASCRLSSRYCYVHCNFQVES